MGTSAVTGPVLQTDRLIMRPIGPADIDALVTHCADINVARWMMHMPHPYTYNDATAFVERVAGKAGRVWGITRDGALIGMMGTSGAFGYWLGQVFWGRGYASEAAIAVLDHYFQDPARDAIAASHMVTNKTSARLLQRLGFQDDGPTEITSRASGKTMPGRAVCLTRAAWQGARGDASHRHPQDCVCAECCANCG
ncbi:GNAT family N-acetyltransferase [Yoonia sp. SS1-5]|uniref:GNAT family N-acetyltransferase n=1 Tax=Yoonia rhodophyticola TaxID=3137370 RepID=A0AAN0NL56_9RHOB